MRLSALLLFVMAHGAAAQTLVRSHVGPAGSGFAIADIGDLDGDGHGDYVSGAFGASAVVAYSSAAQAPLWVASVPGGGLGFSVSAAGDVNADGVEDVIAADTLGNRVLIFDGRNGNQLQVLPAPAGASQFGTAVSHVGDVTGDGRSDLIVGAGGGVGHVYLFSGSDGALLATVAGPAEGSRFGAGLAGTRDLDGDGKRDFIVGAPGANGNLGRAYVYSGATRASLFELAPQANGAGNFGQFFVADAGDVDADGITDLYVGSYTETSGGAAYVFSGRDGQRLHRFLGSSSEAIGPGRGAGDVDGDGRADIIVGGYLYGGSGRLQGGRITLFSGASGAVIARVDGTRVGGQFGFDATGVGDVTGDGRVDFIVASPPANTVDLYAGNGAVLPDPPAFDIVAGLGGAWFEPATDGQGFFLEVNPVAGIIAGGWYTFASLAGGSDAQRWFTVLGSYTGDSAQLDVFLTRGGAFDAGPAPRTDQVGSVVLRFENCTQATASYALRESAITGVGSATEGALRQGEIPLQRLTPNVSCVDAQP